MRGGIVQVDGPVVRARYHTSLARYHDPHGDFPLTPAPLRLAQRQAHKVHVIRIRHFRLSLFDCRTPQKMVD